jgi:hypothetical protein
MNKKQQMSTTENELTTAFSKSGETDKDTLECRKTFYYNNIYDEININEKEEKLTELFIEGLIKYHKDGNIKLDFDFEGDGDFEAGYDNGWASECMMCVLDSWISYDKNNKYRYLIEKLQADPQFSDDFIWGIVDKAMFEIEDPLLRK